MSALSKHQEPARVAQMDELRAFAEAAVASKFYGFSNPDQMLPLMMVAQAQGRSFVSVVEEYSVIQGRPALKAEAMLSRFQRAGGHIKWTELSDTRCAAVFSHPQCDPVEIDWDLERAKQAQLNNPMWKKYPRNMLKARVISDGVRTAYPACLGGMYTPEEVQDFEPAAVSPSRSAVAQDATPRVPALPEAGGVVSDAPPPVSFHDQRSNVAGGFKSLKTIEVDEEQRTDHTNDPEWSILSTSLGNCETKADVNEWWESRKKELRQRKPHFTKAFFQTVVIPTAASFEETVWEDQPEAAG